MSTCVDITFSEQEKKGAALEVDVEVTLEEVYSGKETVIQVKKQVICHRCHGTGTKNAGIIIIDVLSNYR